MIVNRGDTIRSYDFKPMLNREDCYVEGVVHACTTDQDYIAYKITVTKDSWSDGRVGKIVHVPVHVPYLDYPGRVINLSRI